MSNSNIEMNWLSFVKRLRSVGALLLFVMIPYFAFVIIPIQFILAIIAVRNIKNMNQELNNSFLENFYSKYLAASILKFIGSIIVHVAGAMFAVIIAFSTFFAPIYLGPYPVWLFPPAITLMVIGFIVMIVGSSIEVGAWDSLKYFIQDNSHLFAERSLGDIRSSLKNLRTGALLWALGFLIVPIIIGWILQLIGYFTLSNIAKWGIEIEKITPITQDTKPISSDTQETLIISQPTAEPQPEEIIKFCPMCGAKIPEGAKFCGECGVHLDN
jgi:hypothetical protein